MKSATTSATIVSLGDFEIWNGVWGRERDEAAVSEENAFRGLCSERHKLVIKRSAPKSHRFCDLRFAIAMPIADPRNR